MKLKLYAAGQSTATGSVRPKHAASVLAMPAHTLAIMRDPIMAALHGTPAAYDALTAKWLEFINSRRRRELPLLHRVHF